MDVRMRRKIFGRTSTRPGNRKYPAIGIPESLAEAAGIQVGDDVDLIYSADGRIIIQPKGWKPRTEGTQVQMGAVV